MLLFRINWKSDLTSVSARGNFTPWEMCKSIAGKMLSMYLSIIDVDLVNSALKSYELLLLSKHWSYWVVLNEGELLFPCKALKMELNLEGRNSKSCCWYCYEDYLGHTFSVSKDKILLAWSKNSFSFQMLAVLFSLVICFPLFFLSCNHLYKFNKVLKLTLLWGSDI